MSRPPRRALSMQTPGGDSSVELAPQACQSCKSRKRKCDKTLPKCSSCAKRGQACDYRLSEATSTQSAAASTPEQGWSLASSVIEGQQQQHPEACAVDFPTILFLDPALLQHGQVETPLWAPSVPPPVLQLLGDMDEIRSSADRFFRHVHKWMPFISKKRFYDLHLQPAFRSRPDVVLLLLAIKLITTLPPAGDGDGDGAGAQSGGARTPLYYAVKHFQLEVEGAFSILVLQAGVLVALYELGHGIYPAAYLSIGACARYAHALGIHSGSTVPSRRVLTLVEVEERRRVWWAIVILDRFVSIGCPGRPFATADPSLDDLLPADDAAWDEGTVRHEDLSTLSSPMTSHMSKFALLCQAGRLLGQVLHHLASDDDDDDNSEVWSQLDRTLQSMLAAALNIDRPDHDQITFIYSALVALHAPSLLLPTDHPASNDRALRARAVLDQVISRINANLVERQCFLDRDPEDMSPWGLYFAYRICGAHSHHHHHHHHHHHMRNPQLGTTTPHGTPRGWAATASVVARSLREAFRAIDVRWKVAGVYLRLLEAQEAIHLGG